MSVGNMIREYRQKYGMSQTMLAEKVNVTQQTVSQWERGLTAVSDDNKRALSELFNVDLFDLIAHQADENYNPKKWLPDGNENADSSNDRDEADNQASYDNDNEWGQEYGANNDRVGKSGFSSFPPGVIPEDDVWYLTQEFTIPNEEEIAFMLAKQLYGEKAVDVVWGDASIEDKYSNVARYNFHMSEREEYGHGEQFWLDHALWLVDQKIDNVFDLPRQVFLDFIDAYIAARYKDYSRNGDPLTLRRIIRQLAACKDSGDKNGWIKIGVHWYEARFLDIYVDGRAFGQYESLDAAEQFTDLTTDWTDTFRTDAYGYSQWMPLSLVDQKEVEKGVEKRGSLFSRKPAEEWVYRDLYIRPSETGEKFLDWWFGRKDGTPMSAKNENAAYEIVAPDKTSDEILAQADDFGEKVIVKNEAASRRYAHTIVFGPAASGKTTCYIMPNIQQCVKRQESMIITDRDGMIHNACAEYLKENGYTVRCLNLADPNVSDAWNCMDEIANSAGDERYMQANLLAMCILQNVGCAADNGVLYNAKQDLLRALIMQVAFGNNDGSEEHPRALADAFDMLTTYGAEVEQHMDIEELANKAREAIRSAEKASEDGSQIIINDLCQALRPFANAQIGKLMEQNQIDLTSPGKQLCAYFVIPSEKGEQYDCITAAFIALAVHALAECADSKKPGETSVPVNFLLDDFACIGIIPGFDKSLATMRPRGIRCAITVDDLSQLKANYPETWQNILANCGVQLCFGCHDVDTEEYFRKLTATDAMQISEVKAIAYDNLFHSPGTSVMKMENHDVLVVFRGRDAYTAKTYYAPLDVHKK